MDIVRGFLMVAESDRSLGEVINIGSNFEISIGDTVNLIAEIMNTQIEIQTDDQRIHPDKSEVERLWADNTKARELTDREPLYAMREGFKKGLAETVERFTNPDNLRLYKADIYNL